MKTRRSIHFEPAEIRLFMPMLVLLAPTVSTVALGMWLFGLIYPKPECEIPLRLYPAGSSELLPKNSPIVLLRGDGDVEFNGRGCLDGPDKRVRGLIEYLNKMKQAHGVVPVLVYIEPEALFERWIDVISAFQASGWTRYHMVSVPSFTGPRIPAPRVKILDDVPRPAAPRPG